jgi:hypothetical protein
MNDIGLNERIFILFGSRQNAVESRFPKDCLSRNATGRHRTSALLGATAAWSEAFYAAVDEVNDHFGNAGKSG